MLALCIFKLRSKCINFGTPFRIPQRLYIFDDDKTNNFKTNTEVTRNNTLIIQLNT